MKKKQLILSALLLLIVTFAALSPSFIAGFSNWDDWMYITDNPKITSFSLENVKTWFTSYHYRLYHPLLFVVYAAEYHIAGLNPHVYHVTSLILHLLNTLLVFWFAYMLSRNHLAAVITALLFGIHPMHVESVVWLPERKDVLYSFFFLGSLISYLYFIKDKKRNFYYLCMFLFVLSFLSKSMAMTLPFVLLLCDYLLKVKIDRKNLIDKVPFFALSFLFAFITVMGHYEPGVEGREFSFSLIGNFVSACQNIVFYIIKLVLPFKLSCIYPMPSQMQNIPQVIFFLAPVIVIAFIALMFWSGKYSRVGVFGGLFFLVTVAPVSQILPVGLGIPADRYTYIPYIGFFYIFAECFAFAYKRYDKKVLMGILSVLFLVLFILSFQRALVWRDSIVLWDDVIKNYKNIPLAYYNRGDEYFLRLGNYDKALVDFNQAIAVDPKYTSAYINIGLINYFRGNYRTAIDYYNKSLEITKKIPEAYLNRGNTESAIGETVKAIADYDQALKMKPDYTEVWYNRGNVYLKMSEYDKAISDFSHAIKLRPNYADAYNNRGTTYFRMGNMEKAYIDFSQAVWANPNYADAYYNRAVVSSMRGDAASALSDVLKAQNLGMKVDQQVIDKLRKAIE
jgi:tetratricopeptide (TPR) repeat protein